MEIKTKFDIGDKVWMLRNLKAVGFDIHSISICRPFALLPTTRITYCGSYNVGRITTALETECFATKEELIKHITDNGD